MRRLIGAGALIFSMNFAVLWASPAAAFPIPAWKIIASSQTTNFRAGAIAKNSIPQYTLIATNIGGETTSGAITVKDELPTEVTPVDPTITAHVPGAIATVPCGTVGRIVTCTISAPLPPGADLRISIELTVDPLAAGNLEDQASISGGGAANVATTMTKTAISSLPAPFDFLPGEEGLSAPATDDEGFAVKQAGSHPYQWTLQQGFSSTQAGSILIGAEGGLRNLTVELPRGLLVDPAATPYCAEVQLHSLECPDATQVGVVTVLTSSGGPESIAAPIFNMPPPPGIPGMRGAVASLGFEAAGAGVFVHVLAHVRSDSDYGGAGVVRDALALSANPVLGAETQLWGNISDHSHDQMRGHCLFNGGSCEATELGEEAFVVVPTDCSGEQTVIRVQADSWGHPEDSKEAEYKNADLGGDPVFVDGCDELEFEPKITAQPSTNLTDSPTGLEIDVHQRQELAFKDRYTAPLKDATVTFPAGISVNASQANGLSACTSQQIGLLTMIGVSPVHLSDSPANCPGASKLGTVEVSTPLLAQRNAKHEVQRDPSGKALSEPLHGSVYLAKPFDNPFGSLIAVYLTIEDEKTGIFAKLAGKVQPDSVTGQLSTTFEENPELPVEDVKVKLFDGPRASLQTPSVCASYITSAELTSWSAPETTIGVDDSFQTTAAPAGGPCPTIESQLPNHPAFTAGTVSPVAGSYSPFVLKLSRDDGSQRLTKFEATLPAGITARFAGLTICSDAQIARAQARSQPNEGAAEKDDPSCPAGSEVGVVNAGAGAGPNPFYIQGHIYLAGPYKGAPLSLVAITPVLAGPFDLGVVVVRAAVYLDPVTAQARTVSDPFPTILDGIPVDLRSVAVKINRSSYVLNPTSCAEKSFSGTATSTLGLIAPLSERFQVTGCRSLPYKPKLHARLFGPIHRGGHPRLRTVFEAKPGEAGTKRISFALPHSEFIDQAHFRTICTRVQFAANQCPAGSVYGHVKAITPLFDYALEGPIYLRSSSHQLPDTVLVLKGPPNQPIEVDLDGRVDSVNGGLRFTFDQVPDAPVKKVIITAQGGHKGLFQNSTNICKDVFRATLKLDGQNGKVRDTKPQLKAQCPKASKGAKPGGHRR